MPHAGGHFEITAQVLLDGFCLRRRFYDHKVLHAFLGVLVLFIVLARGRIVTNCKNLKRVRYRSEAQSLTNAIANGINSFLAVLDYAPALHTN
ncbi:MAG: hypothetical protein RLZZ273_1265 [Bacteroidota bacterium]